LHPATRIQGFSSAADIGDGQAVFLKYGLMDNGRYDPRSRTLTLTAAQAQAWRRQIGYWTDYFQHPAGNGGLKPNLISDPAELRQFTAFVTWAALFSVREVPLLIASIKGYCGARAHAAARAG
jgi:nitric oxide reductase large subunit